jgi:hypothetical protein
MGKILPFIDKEQEDTLRLIAEGNRLKAELESCDDKELVDLFSAAEIQAPRNSFSVKWRAEFYGNNQIFKTITLDKDKLISFGINNLKRDLHQIIKFRQEYNLTPRGYYPLQVFLITRGRHDLPLPGWVEEWIFNGLNDYGQALGQTSLDDLLFLRAGKQGASNEWRIKNKRASELDQLFEIARLAYGCGFGMTTARIIVGRKWDLDSETLREYQKLNPEEWNWLKKTYSKFDPDMALSFLYDDMNPYYKIIFDDHKTFEGDRREEKLLTPQQRKRARSALQCLIDAQQYFAVSGTAIVVTE